MDFDACEHDRLASLSGADRWPSVWARERYICGRRADTSIPSLVGGMHREERTASGQVGLGDMKRPGGNEGQTRWVRTLKLARGTGGKQNRRLRIRLQLGIKNILGVHEMSECHCHWGQRRGEELRRAREF